MIFLVTDLAKLIEKIELYWKSSNFQNSCMWSLFIVREEFIEVLIIQLILNKLPP
jgi:hypothetical protein